MPTLHTTLAHTSSVKSLNRRRLLVLGATSATLLASGVRAQAYPGRAIKLIVPFNAGGATDIVARLIGDKLSTRLGQPVLIDNRGGAAGILGTDAVAKAAPDGYTFVLSLSNSLMTNQFLYDKLPYNTQRDLALVSHIASAPVTLVVHPSVTANNGPELLQYMANNKKKLSYGSWGVGSYAHLAGSHMSLTQQADMVHIAYKGEAPMLQDLIGGQLQMAYASAAGSKPHIEAGRLKIIGVTGLKRMIALPNVATLNEQGLRDEVYSIAGWVGMAAPANTPKDIIQRISQEVQSICETQEVTDRISAMGFTVTAGTPEAFAASYKRDMPIWEKLVKQSGAKLE